MVYAVFYRGSGIGGALVRWWTKSRFGHCAIRIDDAIYEAVGWRSKFPWWRGEIVKRPVNHHEDGAVQVPCPWANARRVAARCEMGLPCSYDWPALIVSAEQRWFRGGFSLVDKRTGAYDCSRFVQYALELPFDGTPTPQDIYDLTMERSKWPTRTAG